MATALTATTLSHKTLTALGTPAACDVTGNTCPNGGLSFLYVENGSTSRTLTVAFARGVDGTIPAALSFTVGASFKGFLPLGSPADYGSTVTVTGSNAEVLLKLFQLR